jgi:phage-related baseplate assembly protein
MSLANPIDLAAYPVADVLEVLSFEAYLARDRADLASRWEARRAARPSLPAFDALFLESDPSSVILEVGSYRELLLRARVNDAIRSLTLAGARGAALDHIGATYYRTARRDGEDDETLRQRLALAPESWSIAGPIGAYVFWGLSASPDVRDIAVYSEDEGVAKSAVVRVVILSDPAANDPPGDGTASAELLARVQSELRRADRRPLADWVVTESAVALPFDVSVHLTIRSGVSAAIVAAQAKARIEAYCRGRLRWAGEGETGPLWLIGRTFTVEALAGVAMGGDPNILEADVAGSTINPPHVGYTAAALADVGTDAFTPLPAEITAHLFRAPVLGSVTVTHAVASLGWIG